MLPRLQRTVRVNAHQTIGRTTAGRIEQTPVCERDRHRPRHQSAAGFRTRRGVGNRCYFKCLLTSLVMSNIFTEDLPPKTVLRVASALIIRLFF